MAIEVKIQRKLNTFELNIDFKSDSKRIGILGASGCGKSMTLKSIAGIEPPESGLIKIEGKTVYDSENKVNLKPQKRNIGYLFQNYALFPTMTVEKNIAAGLKGKKQENAKRVREMIEKFQLTGLEKRFPAELSGGQQQRVALARIMAYKPDVILLDEPFSALDMYLKDRLQQELQELFEDYEGTVIMVSHSRDEVYRFSEELLIIDQGQIVREISAEELEHACRKCIRLTVSDTRALACVLDKMRLEYSIVSEDEADVFGELNISELVLALAQEECQVLSLHEKDESLESYYVNLMGGASHE